MQVFRTSLINSQQLLVFQHPIHKFMMQIGPIYQKQMKSWGSQQNIKKSLLRVH